MFDKFVDVCRYFNEVISYSVCDGTTTPTITTFRKTTLSITTFSIKEALSTKTFSIAKISVTIFC